MNSGQKKILITIIAYTLLWNGQYLWEYLPGLFDMAIMLILFLTIVILTIVGVFQVIKYLTEEPKIRFRLINIGLITLILILTYNRPFGLIDFTKFEGENILYAMREGTANCTTSIRLKEGNRFKKTSICFGIDHFWGTYEIVNDTIKFHYDKVSEENIADDFAVFQLENDTTSKRLGRIHYHSKGLRKEGVSMRILELRREKFELIKINEPRINVIIYSRLIGNNQRSTFTGIEKREGITYTNALLIHSKDSLSINYRIESLKNWKPDDNIEGVAKLDLSSISNSNWKIEDKEGQLISAFRFLDNEKDCYIEILISKEENFSKSISIVKEFCKVETRSLTVRMNYK